MKPIRHESFWAEDITVRDRLRPLNAQYAAELAESVKKIGLTHAVSVRLERGIDPEEPDARCPVLIAGYHRLEACRLAKELVYCAIFDCTEDEARLWEISENLHRAELTALERSEHVAEWVRLTDINLKAQLAPLDKPHDRGRQNKGINAATRELGIERTEAQRSVKIASLSDEAKATAREVGLDNNQTALIAAAKSSDPDAELRRYRAEKDAKESAKRNRDTDQAIKISMAQEFGEWLRSHAESNEIPMVISWLEGCKPKEVIAALRREAA